MRIHIHTGRKQVSKVNKIFSHLEETKSKRQRSGRGYDGSIKD